MICEETRLYGVTVVSGREEVAAVRMDYSFEIFVCERKEIGRP